MGIDSTVEFKHNGDGWRENRKDDGKIVILEVKMEKLDGMDGKDGKERMKGREKGVGMVLALLAKSVPNSGQQWPQF